MTPAMFAASLATKESGALPPHPRNLSHNGSEHPVKEAGQPKLADAPIITACSGCIPAVPYPCRDGNTIQHQQD